MQRVVVFMGGTRDAVSAVQAALPSSAKALDASGVVVPKSGRVGNRATGFTHQPLALVTSSDWVTLQTELATAEGDTVLLTIPGLLRLGRSNDRRKQILERLTTVADEIIVVSVVADQLTLINDAYLAQVASWRTSKRFESVLPNLLDNDTFVHEKSLQPWCDDQAVRYIAIPLGDLLVGHPVAVVLQACGVELSRIPSMEKVPPQPKLGSVGVEANRLLATYLRAKIRGFDPTSPGLVPASRAALLRAAKLGWCSDLFWGWSRRSADKALARFDVSNHRFAQAVWGTAWTLPYPLERACTRVDFLDLEPQVVDQMQRFVMGTAGRVKRELASAR